MRECTNNYQTLSLEIKNLQNYIEPYLKIIRKKTLELEYYKKHKSYATEITSVINDCKKNIGNKRELINICIKKRDNLCSVKSSLYKEINEQQHKLTSYKAQFDKTGCMCRWNRYVHDNCAVCFTDSKLFAISCKNNHFFCKVCIGYMKQKNSKCPYCREGLCNIASFMLV